MDDWSTGSPGSKLTPFLTVCHAYPVCQQRFSGSAPGSILAKSRWRSVRRAKSLTLKTQNAHSRSTGSPSTK